jgi:hypothetical protein
MILKKKKKFIQVEMFLLLKPTKRKMMMIKLIQKIMNHLIMDLSIVVYVIGIVHFSIDLISRS